MIPFSLSGSCRVMIPFTVLLLAGLVMGGDFSHPGTMERLEGGKDSYHRPNSDRLEGGKAAYHHRSNSDYRPKLSHSHHGQQKHKKQTRKCWQCEYRPAQFKVERHEIREPYEVKIPKTSWVCRKGRATWYEEGHEPLGWYNNRVQQHGRDAGHRAGHGGGHGRDVGHRAGHAGGHGRDVGHRAGHAGHGLRHGSRYRRDADDSRENYDKRGDYVRHKSYGAYSSYGGYRRHDGKGRHDGNGRRDKYGRYDEYGRRDGYRYESDAKQFGGRATRNYRPKYVDKCYPQTTYEIQIKYRTSYIEHKILGDAGGFDECRGPLDYYFSASRGVDDWDCESNCYVRKDAKGNLSRGCYSGQYKVNPDWLGCHYQGDGKKQLYCFCEGDHCNGKSFD